MKRIELKTAASTTRSLGGAATFLLRTRFSQQHVRAAAHFAVQAHTIELRYKGRKEPPPTEVGSRHRAYVTGAIFATVAFLEAFINEVFSDAADEHERDFGSLPPGIVKSLGDIWKTDMRKFSRYSILKKYETALELAGIPLWERKRNPYEDVNALRELRNALVHYKPEWARGGHSPSDKMALRMERRLNGKFPLNPFVSQGNPFFPDQCLGHGVAKWAIDSSMSFVNDFINKLGVPTLKGHLPEDLNTCADGSDT